MARDGRAILGISHAGEVIAAVKLSIAELASFGVRAIELAAQQGADLDQLELAVREPIYGQRKIVRARQRLERKNVVRRKQRAARVRLGTCQDCGAEIRKTGTGKMPKRCGECRAAHHRRDYHNRQEAAGRPQRPNRAICLDCGAEVPVLSMGPVPQRCVGCAKEHAREANRKRARDAWRMKHWGNTEARPDDR